MLDLYFYHRDDEIRKQLASLEKKLMANFDAVNAANAALKVEVARAIDLLNSLPSRVAAAVEAATAGDQAVADALAVDVTGTADSLKAANDAVPA